MDDWRVLADLTVGRDSRLFDLRRVQTLADWTSRCPDLSVRLVDAASVQALSRGRWRLHGGPDGALPRLARARNGSGANLPVRLVDAAFVQALHRGRRRLNRRADGAVPGRRAHGRTARAPASVTGSLAVLAALTLSLTLTLTLTLTMLTVALLALPAGNGLVGRLIGGRRRSQANRCGGH